MAITATISRRGEATKRLRGAQRWLRRDNESPAAKNADVKHATQVSLQATGGERADKERERGDDEKALQEVLEGARFDFFQRKRVVSRCWELDVLRVLFRRHRANR